MPKKIQLVIAAFAVLLTFAACSHAQAPDSLPNNSPVSSSSAVASDEESSEPSSPSSSLEESETSTEDTNTLLSAHLWQSHMSGFLYWELDITDTGELELLDELLSSDGLSPLKKGEARWTDGGSPISFELKYTDETIEGACNPQYVYTDENDRSTMRVGDIFYAYPRETGDKLLGFLESKEIVVD